MCFRPLLIVSVLLFLGSSGCGGGASGENGSDPFGSGATTEAFTITLAILDQQCGAVSEPSFTAGDTLCIQATLSNNGENVSGQIVIFETGLGALSATSKLTNSNGVAEVTLSSDASNVGASSLNASFDSVNTGANYEFLAAYIAVVNPPSINVVMLKGGQPSVRFKADEQVQLQSRLVDQEGLPIEGVIINFVTGKGVLNTSDALTDSQGVAEVSLSTEISELGAAVATAQARVNNVDLVSSLNFEVQSVDAISDQIIRVGHFTTNGVFVENVIGVSATNTNGDAEISAGATLGLSIALVDQNGQRFLTPSPVSFTSTCVEANRSSIDLQVNTINGVAQVTYEDISCAGSEGNVDTVIASLILDNSTVTLARGIVIQGESIGSISFVSAQPTQIVLQGTGGQNNQTVSTLVFEVLGGLGNPLSQQQVKFSLNTKTGGLTLSPDKGITNSQGQVSTRVTSGNVPTSIRVTAEVMTNSDISVLTQSDLLSVNTGLPDQNSFTLSADNLNPEANNISGQTVNIIARLADTFNNPVPDGTSISFTTEGGIIEPSCTTTNATCRVIWTSANPRVLDHRVTILATAIGHETLFDANGNNSYEDSDGGPIVDNTDSGFGGSDYGVTGFVDYSEAWRDDNENNSRDTAEIFLDYDDDGSFDGDIEDPERVFNGPQCIPGNACGQGIATSLHVRKALVLVMSSSNALMDITDAGNTIIFSNYQTASQPSLSIARGSSLSFRLRFSDSAVQPIASGSRIVISSSAGSLAGQINTLMPRTNRAGVREANFTLTNDVDIPVDSTLTATITSPSGIESAVVFQVKLN
ncbi:Ig-like domain-containing protein [Paraglaciecola psychrophila]|uniref:Ig-like protein n=1 Tax=Paraglaciecola psychrophila 170 TaxID=1129794 RepID=K7AM26_9ALTE|nr:Ig-like domain-containing protein [Paraglaciecola psychrophila]AGH47429.1 Ig-like protein [Paraglaciecola psychrophila 170]GAC36445.1 Ig-like protein, group 1 [Paraglaciecola psychrophila 170]